MSERIIRVVTRGSKLAVAQTALVLERLRALFPARQFEPLVVKTAGDAASDERAVAAGKGIFVKELEEALLRGEAALAVHSLKDLPVELPKGLVITAVPEREDARDALISKSGARLAELPPGAIVGTGSGRRAAQLLAARPDLRIEPIRGNLDTRIAKLMGRRESAVAYDAIVVAAAGCLRLGLDEAITELLPVDLVLPAPGQGALAIETREDDAETRAVVAAIEDEAARCAVEAERACLRALGGGCRVPIAAYAEAAGGSVVLRARVCSLDGRQVVEGRRTGPAAEAASVGATLANDLLGRGAGRLVGPDAPENEGA